MFGARNELQSFRIVSQLVFFFFRFHTATAAYTAVENTG